MGKTEPWDVLIMRTLIEELAIALAEPCDYWHHAAQRYLADGCITHSRNIVWC